MASVSGVILTKNEENNIVDCIESLQWCNETIVIDDNSADRTVELAKTHKAKVFTHELAGNFSEQRNFGLEKAEGDYVLFIDADERVSLSLQYEILSILNNPLQQYKGFYFKRKDILWGKELNFGETGNIRLLRLGKKGVGIWRGKVHEKWHIKGETYDFQNTLQHFPHQTLLEFLREINFYTGLRAHELYKEKKKSSIFTIIAYPIGKFGLNYFLKRGFLDGIEGLLLAILMSFHSFLVRGKLWLLWQKKAEK
jgi:glycosyltransferase involved in cell wall biosynthesis